MAESHHRYTGLLLLLFALLVLVGAVFLTLAQSRVASTPEHDAGNTKLRSASSDLLIAYILGYIAGGIAIVLAILYFGHVTWGIKSEIPHLILFILLFGLIIVSAIFGFLALSDISGSAIDDKKGGDGWIWGGLIAYLIAVIVLLISGAWRAQYVSSGGPAAASTPAPVTTTFTTGENIGDQPVYQSSQTYYPDPSESQPASYPVGTQTYSMQ